MGQLLAWYLRAHNSQTRENNSCDSPQAVSAGITETKMSAGQNESVSHVTHADHTLRPGVLHVLLIPAVLRLPYLVLYPVDLLQEVAQPVHVKLLFDCLESKVAVRLTFNDGDGKMRLSRLFTLLRHAMNTHRHDLAAGAVVEVGLVRLRSEDVLRL